jgi:hypothetical protein
MEELHKRASNWTRERTRLYRPIEIILTPKLQLLNEGEWIGRSIECAGWQKRYDVHTDPVRTFTQ